MYPPTNQQIRPRHIRRRLTQQKHHSGRNLLGQPNSAQRRSTLHQLPTSLRRLIPRCPGLIRLDKRRTYRIYSDVEGGEFGGEDLGEDFYAAFGDVVAGHAVAGEVAVGGYAGYEDYAAASACWGVEVGGLEVFDEELGGEEGA